MTVSDAAFRLSRLAQVQMFAGLGPAALAPLAQAGHSRRYMAGALILCEEMRCVGLPVLLRGRVRLFVSSAGGELDVGLRRAPAVIAEIPLFDGGSYLVSAQATTAAEVLFLPVRDFQALRRADPEVDRAATRGLCGRLRALCQLTKSLGLEDLEQRLARLLLERCQRDRNESRRLWVVATHQDLALASGSVREVVSRKLNELQADGLIHLCRGRIEIVDRGALARLAVGAKHHVGVVSAPRIAPAVLSANAGVRVAGAT